MSKFSKSSRSVNMNRINDLYRNKSPIMKKSTTNKSEIFKKFNSKLQKKKLTEKYEHDKFSRFLTKNKNWFTDKKSIRTKKYLEEESNKIKSGQTISKQKSFVTHEQINQIIQKKMNLKESKVDFYRKDVRKKNFSMVGYFGTNVLYDR